MSSQKRKEIKIERKKKREILFWKMLKLKIIDIEKIKTKF